MEEGNKKAAKVFYLNFSVKMAAIVSLLLFLKKK